MKQWCAENNFNIRKRGNSQPIKRERTINFNCEEREK